MTPHLVTFSDDQMSRSRALCIESALRHGVDSVAGPHYFDPAIEARDGFTLDWLKTQPIYDWMGEDWWQQRGVGYWLWKPYVIDLVMRSLPDGDIIVYADAGVEFVNNVRYIIDRMEPMAALDVMLQPQGKASTGDQSDVFLFGNNWEHAHWCKRDVVEAVWPTAIYSADCRLNEHIGPESVWAAFGKQVQASAIFFRVSDYSRRIALEWLEYCRLRTSHCTLIDDSPSILPNHPEFQEHRHDQAILTTLAYREGIKLHYWPAMYNGGAFVYEKLPVYANDDYPTLFHHHRKRDDEYV